MIILGAGMAGLLAGCMIRDEKVSIWEAAPNLPNNHSAVLRFRSSIVGDAIDIEFKKVKMMKCMHPWRNAVADNLAYSLKTNGTATLRSSISADASITERYIAPANMIELMANRNKGDIYFQHEAIPQTISGMNRPIISTIPMPFMMKLLNYKNVPEFNYVNGYNINFEVENVDAYVSVYIPDPSVQTNRISITGNRVTIERSCPDIDAAQLTKEVELLNKYEKELRIQALGDMSFLGLEKSNAVPAISKLSASMQRYSKILPINENERKRFILWASEKHGVYSLGRFATWRPNLLLDDVVNDVRVIRRIIKNGSYDYRIK